jgi:hypothetical protein
MTTAAMPDGATPSTQHQPTKTAEPEFNPAALPRMAQRAEETTAPGPAAPQPGAVPAPAPKQTAAAPGEQPTAAPKSGAVPQQPPQSAMPTPGGPLTPASPPIGPNAGGYIPTGYAPPVNSPYAGAAGPGPYSSPHAVHQRKSTEVHPTGYMQNVDVRGEVIEEPEERQGGWLKWLKAWVDGVNEKVFGWMGGKAS